VLAASPALAKDEPACRPFRPSVCEAIGTSAEPGVQPSRPADGPAGLAEVAPGTGTGPTALAGEALLALPQKPDGSVPKDFELVPGARVVESFFSPVLCAAVVRIAGPALGSPASLVSRVPDTAVAVPHHLYRTAAAVVRSVVGAPAAGGSDPYRPLQWGLDDLGVDAARGEGNGRGVRVAIVDSAPEIAHPELLRVRVREIPGGPLTAAAPHGTLVAGVVAAAEANGIGIAGVAPAVDAVAIPACAPEGEVASDVCRLYDALRGIDLAWEERAAIVNLSIVGPNNPLLERAMERLEELGVLVVAAAGNEGTGDARYPAAYATVIGVGALDRAGRPYVRSNRGASARVGAPGVEILSTHPGHSFAFADGTSLAAAHVSGALAVLLGADVLPFDARTALLGATPASSGTHIAHLPSMCEALARAGRPCPATP
jgi:hypothetical protein